MNRISFNKKGTKYTGDIGNGIYNQSYAGNALTVLFTRGVALASDVDPNNIIARGQNYNWNETYQILPVLEWDTYFYQEIVLGMQDMGSFDVSMMFTLRNNDSLPTVRTLAWETEMQMIQKVGVDHPLSGLVQNVWYGGRFIGRGGTMSPNGLYMDSVRGIYRYRLTGKDWKYVNSDAYYPGEVKSVEMGTSIGAA
jgi:hypothetical protein